MTWHRLPTLGTLALAVTLVAGGCSSTRLDQARRTFYSGAPEQAAESLASADVPKIDRVLLLMERGMMRRVAHDHRGAIDDWLNAASLAKEFDYLSVSRQSASLAVNDAMLAYRGPPYEQVLLHTFAATSFLALGLPDSAGVEARRTIRILENRGAYPDSAYARYVAGFCLEAAGDAQGSAVQYRIADKLHPTVTIDSATGILQPAPPAEAIKPESAVNSGRELIVFVGIGRAPGAPAAWQNQRWGRQPFARIRQADLELGRTYSLSTVTELLSRTEKVTSARKAAKTATRIAIKESVSHAVRQQNESLGELLRILLYALETPDSRRWETLPQWLQVGRVSLPQTDAPVLIECVGPDGVLASQELRPMTVGNANRSIALLRFL